MPEPGVTPDSPLYFFDTLGENFSLFFARTPEDKIRVSADIASEKAAEVEAMVEEGKFTAAQGAADRYGGMISTAADSLAASAQSGEGFDAALADLVGKATSIHLSVLADVYTRVPDQAKSSIEEAMQQSARGQEEAINALSGRPEDEELLEEAEARKQEVEDRIEGLREEGKPIPTIEPSSRIPENGQGAAPAGAGSETRGAPVQPAGGRP